MGIKKHKLALDTAQKQLFTNYFNSLYKIHVKFVTPLDFYQLDSGVDRVQKRPRRRNELSNRAGGGTCN